MHFLGPEALRRKLAAVAKIQVRAHTRTLQQ
jgi:hypothetical protein